MAPTDQKFRYFSLFGISDEYCGIPSQGVFALNLNDALDFYLQTLPKSWRGAIEIIDIDEQNDQNTEHIIYWKESV